MTKPGKEIIDALKRKGLYGSIFSYDDYQMIKQMNSVDEFLDFLESKGIKGIPSTAGVEQIIDHLYWVTSSPGGSHPYVLSASLDFTRFINTWMDSASLVEDEEVGSGVGLRLYEELKENQLLGLGFSYEQVQQLKKCETFKEVFDLLKSCGYPKFDLASPRTWKELF